MPVITITGQHGSNSDKIAQEVARSQNLRLVEADIINEVAVRLGVPLDSVSQAEGRDPNLVSELVRTMRRLYPATLAPPGVETGDLDEATYLQVIRQVVWEVARSGNALILARGAQFILQSHPDILHILLVAPLPVRIERVMAAEGLDHAHAAQRIKEVDESRSRYARHFYRSNWLDVNHYDLVLSTGHFSELAAASLISAAVSPLASPE